MNTLAQPALAALLERLFAESDATSPAEHPALATLSANERHRLMHSRTEYLDYYARMKDLALPVSRETGQLLYMLVRGSRASSVVEFGTSFGISTLHLAAALRDNGGGRVLTTEFEPSKVLRAQAHLEAAGLADLVEIRQGDALQTLRGGLPGEIDLVLLDGAKALYPQVLALLESRLHAGSWIVADNADFSPEYLQWVRDPANGYLSIPFGEDVELSLRLG